MTSPHPSFPWDEEYLHRQVGGAVAAYWTARSGQAAKQKLGGVLDAGTRGEVTGGQHLDAFCNLLTSVMSAAGFGDDEIRFRTGVEIPGYYRPAKKWDIVVMRGGRLCAAVEMKSQVGPSFGNNINNRAEEAVGNATDLWLAFREGVLGAHPPWLGYFFLLEEAQASTRVVSLPRAVFEPDPIFRGTSYAQRYEILCRRMVLERNYSAASLLLTPRGVSGKYSEPSPDLAIEPFLRGLYGHLVGCK